jgi:hypothetical protein
MNASTTLRLTLLTGALAATAASAGAFAQTAAAPANPSQAVPQGYTQIEPPKDPLVQRREDRAHAQADYKATKSEARSEYKATTSEAKQEKKADYRAADAAARDAMTPAQQAPKQ